MRIKSSLDVLTFWFDDIDVSAWFKKDPAFDALLLQRFGATLEAASCCELSDWRGSAEGRLAEIIVLDQFSRSIYRGSPEAFRNDPLALALAQEAVRQGCDSDLSDLQKPFLYMPYMHSESKAIHEASLRLFTKAGLSKHVEFELKHKVIIDRFGRYPHRNAVLGRESTPEEVEFLSSPDSSF